MGVKEILTLLDPRHQNLPTLKTSHRFDEANLVYIPVIEDKERELSDQFSVLKNFKFSGKKDEFKEVPYKNQILRFYGLGKADAVNSRVMRRFYGKVYLSALAGKPKSIAMICAPDFLAFAATGVHVAALDPGMLKKEWKKEPAPEVTFIHPAYKKPTRAQALLEEGKTMAEAKNLMRILGALPPNILNQQTYAELAIKLAKKWKVSFKRVPQKELKRYEVLQAVSLGSGRPSELVIFKLDPPSGPTAHATAMIGKGICYDSGGLIGKQDHMKSMKEDMAGSAAMLATILAIKKNNWHVQESTYFLIPIAQNMMGSQAMRADDIYTAGDGQKVEITHTDAEGRLVLGEAICYAKNHFKNIGRYFTVATLTGSCLRAFGDVYTGMLCNDRLLQKQVESMGKEVGDFLHAGPWDLEYDDFSCPVADVPNMGENAEAGWIKGALYMNRFLPKDAEYCHLDIAGSIDMYEKGKPWRRKGFNSGVLVHLLSQFLTE